jgi:ribosomal protein S18 acetylase RimI-like enzyme
VAELAGVNSPETVDVIWVEREWTEPGFDLAADARVDDGGYAGVWDGRGKAWIDLVGAPGDELLVWAEDRAREKGLSRALASHWSDQRPVQELLERNGYARVRSNWRMLIDLADANEQPVWPEGVTVRTFRPGDERTFYDVHQESFADHWEHEQHDPYEEWAHWLLQPPLFQPELWFLAEENGEPAGIAMCNRREPELPHRGHVNILGVRRPWRRRGVGRALLLHAFQQFKRAGLTEADLGVDAESLTGAHRLYESAGMHVSARRDIYEKQLG